MDITALSFEQQPKQFGNKARVYAFGQPNDDCTKKNSGGTENSFSLKVDVLSLHEASLKQREWRDLASRALEPNIFYEPGFILSATRQLVQSAQPSFLFVSNLNGKLLGVFPFIRSKLDFGAAVLRGWQDVNMALGVPLIDAEYPDHVLQAVLNFAASSIYKTVLFPKIYEKGPFSEALNRVTSSKNCKIVSLHKTCRAFLNHEFQSKTYFKKNWSRKKLKDLGRQRRRLSEIGTLKYKITAFHKDISEATDRFLNLESSGWKGRNGTALLQKAGKADFARAMMAGLALTGKAEIHELYCDKTLIASGIVLKTDKNAWFWKVAHNENFDKFSPGVLLVESLTQHYLVSKSLLTVDSCAIQNHPMIDSLWTDRVSITNWMAETSDKSGFSFNMSVIREKLMYRLRQKLRTIYIRFKKSKNN